MLLLFVKGMKDQDKCIKNALLHIQLQCFSMDIDSPIKGTNTFTYILKMKI